MNSDKMQRPNVILHLETMAVHHSVVNVWEMLSPPQMAVILSQSIIISDYCNEINTDPFNIFLL